MTLFGFEIQINPSLRTNPLTLVFLGLILIMFYTTMTGSGYFANYRFGDSIIPKESQLVRSGPYFMQVVNVPHRGAWIRFKPVAAGVGYMQRIINFNNPDERSISSLVDKLHNQPVAYLWLYPDNPLRQVWKVDINQYNVLSYDRAIFVYRIDSDPLQGLIETVGFFVMFLLSMLSIECVYK
ncbi:hypothetical protein [Sulfuriferula nivalis]|uniref:Uncharacterized protein n=1 Tax=Sulfuriferula nivalis TaxID=2675298 RepID=A0A809SDG3_9PROT|nr:hypothetical protein [Sulfuriferula nivalis]BBP00557.1 hypothetical protein SFSGTM_12650 [Sulfuriferula nivalis]